MKETWGKYKMWDNVGVNLKESGSNNLRQQVLLRIKMSVHHTKADDENH